MSSSFQSRGERYRTRSALRVGKILIAVGLVLLIIWLAISAFRLFRAGQSLSEQQERLESLLEAGILNADFDELERIVFAVREDVIELKQVAGPFAAGGRLLGWLPSIGPLVADGQDLLEMADAGSEMALYAVSGLKPALALSGGDEQGLANSLPELVAALDAAEPHLSRADLAANRLFESRAALSHEADYPDQLTTLLSRLDDNSRLVQDGLKLSLIAPDLLGFDEQQTYLILAQNEDELRPSGGFISGAGIITVEQGQIVGLSFENANLIDDWQHKPYDLPPKPFTEFMGMDIFLFRDANFWPDFARSAVQAMSLYSYGQNVELDGVMAIDQRFLQQLLATTGPLQVPELERIVDTNSVVDQLREEWRTGGDSANWIIQRKAFMAPMANAFRAQLESGLLSAKGFELAQALQSAAEQRHLQLYVADPDVARILDETVWSGRVDATDGRDFIHVTDTNMGFNKVNAVVDRSITYNVRLDEEGGSLAALEVHYKNPPAAGAVECRHGTLYDPDTQYESLTRDCYWNYLRAYVPGGSELLSASEHPVAAESLMSGVSWPGVAREADGNDSAISDRDNVVTVFDNFILLAPGQETTVEFRYALPDSVLLCEGNRCAYWLHVRKQAGTAAQTARIAITLPEGAELLETTPTTAVNGNSLTFDATLSNDLNIEVAYRR